MKHNENNSARNLPNPMWILSDDSPEYKTGKDANKRFTAAQNAPYLLSKEQLDDPQSVIAEFFQNRHLAEHRETLWQILSAAITSDYADTYDSREIGGWVIYFRLLEEMIEAAWLIDKQNKKE